MQLDNFGHELERYHPQPDRKPRRAMIGKQNSPIHGARDPAHAIEQLANLNRGRHQGVTYAATAEKLSRLDVLFWWHSHQVGRDF